MVYCISVLSVNSVFEKRLVYVLLGVLIVTNALLAALRPEGTQDTDIYNEVYADSVQSVSSVGFQGFENIFANRSIQHIDLGYVVLMSLFRGIFADPFVFYFVQGVVSNVLSIYGLFALCLFVHNITDREAAERLFNARVIQIFGFYLLFCGILYTSSAIRDGLSIALALCALGDVLLGRHRVRAGVFALLSILFHATSIIFILFFIVLKLFKFSLSKEQVAALCAIAVVMYALGLGKYTVMFVAGFGNTILDFLGISAFRSYLNQLDYQLPLREGYLVLATGFIMILGYAKRNERADTCVVIVLIGMFMMALAYPMPAIVRFFYIFVLFMIPVMVDESSKFNAVWYVSIVMLVPQAIYVFGYLQF